MIRRSKAFAAMATLTALGGLAASGVGAAAVGTSAARRAPSHVNAKAVARPFALLASKYSYAAPPTTSQCVATQGISCYSPIQIETAYDMNSLYAQNLNGAGKTIAIVDSFGSPTIASDLKHFDEAYGIPAPPHLTIIQPAGPVTGYQQGWEVETSLDVEYAHAMAPGANILLVETPVAETEGTVGFPQIVEAENYVIHHHLADIISQSFGATEATFKTPGQLLALRSAYKAAQAANVTVLAASGDYGSTEPSFTGIFGRRVVDWPASDPLVTSVGGTQLHLNNAGQRVGADNVWNDTNLLGSPAAGGGGTSAVFARPAFQNGVSSVVGSWRGVPDVALSAAVDGGALVYLGFIGNGGWFIVGGTSWACPTFSGIVAVADQAAGHDLGLLDPMLYSLAASGASGISDITTGNNTVSFIANGKSVTVPGWVAGPGYDLASGLGTVDGANLVSELAASGAARPR